MIPPVPVQEREDEIDAYNTPPAVADQHLPPIVKNFLIVLSVLVASVWATWVGLIIYRSV